MRGRQPQLRADPLSWFMDRFHMIMRTMTSVCVKSINDDDRAVFVLNHLMMMIQHYLCDQDFQVAHKSERNLSSSSRHAYTFHIIETEGSHYASKNWLQPTAQSPLPRLYFHTRKP